MGIKKYADVIINNPVASLWVLFHRARRLIFLDYYLGGYSFFPDFITILITKRCNFNCGRCASKSQMVTQETFDELSTPELKRFIDQVSWIKPFVYFSGGEPLLRKDIFELISYIKRKDMLTGLVSNGSSLDEESVNKILDSRLDFFSVSIDGARVYHDQARGVEGAFDKAVHGLKLLVEARKKRKATFPHIRIASIIDPQNLDNSISMVHLANELEVDELAFGNLMFYPPSIKKEQKEFGTEAGLDLNFINGIEIDANTRFNIDKEKLAEFLKAARQSKRVPVCFVPENTDFDNYYSFKHPSSRSRCFKPWFSLTVLPDGSLTPCQGLILGNIKEGKFLQCWNSAPIKRFRTLRKRLQPPACFRCGEGQTIKFDS